jgi:GntR family transcriptional regulator
MDTYPKSPPERLSCALDPASATPLWLQLHTQIVGRLQRGQWQVGESLPSERDLSEQLKVSRITVKRCYDELRREGWLSRGSGRGGSTVQQPNARIQPSLGRLKGFTEEMTELGKTPSTQVLSVKVVQDRMIASVFGRPSTAAFLHLVRLRYANAIAMTREVAWYDLTLAPALSDWNGQGSAYALLRERCGLTLKEATQTVEAVMSSQSEASQFGVEQPLPCLLFKRRTYAGEHNELVEYVEGLFRGDLYVYQMPLTT